MRRFRKTVVAATLVLIPFGVAAQDKPNILVIWGDDIGQSNISALSVVRVFGTKGCLI
ncbi:MAG: hypothetical protein ACU0BB_13795 [Paracoccaceae bacterium]